MVYGYGLYIPNCPECDSNDIDVIDQQQKYIDECHERLVLTCSCYSCRHDFKYVFDIRGKYLMN